jgi:uncharacterized membrane-anchored protein
MQLVERSSLGKLPAVTFAFWIIKIAATTLGETGGDAVSMSMNLGYAAGTAIFAVLFLIALSAQIAAKTYRPFIYWTVIVATTTVGTTLADFVDRSLGVGYPGGTAILAALLAGTLFLWKRSCGSISVKKISTAKGEAFYWITILFSNTLGTACGDFLVDDSGLGYLKSALVFSAVLAVLVILKYTTRISVTALFWLGFIFTRPLGATLGDFLTKAHEKGGLELSRFSSTAVLAVFMVACIALFSRKAEIADAPRSVKA